MTVRAILELKGKNVVTTTPQTLLVDVAQVMAERRIGAIVVVDADGVAGIISERDLVRALAQKGASALDAPVASVMTRDVVTCGCDESIPGIMGRMTNGKFRHVPVMDRNRLVGIVSIGDVVKHRMDQIEHESSALVDYIRSA